jgi:PEP-CTERM motif
MENIKNWLISMLAGTLMSTTSSATIFTDSALFDAANPGLTLLNFENIAPIGGFILPTPQPWATDVLFTNRNDGTGSIAITDSGFSFGTPTDALFVDYFNVPILGTFGTPTRAVGFNVAIGFGGLSATVEVFDSAGGSLDSATFPTANQRVFTSFIGFSDLGEIGSVRITPLRYGSNVGFALIDNFRFENADKVPAPATLAIFSLGLAGLGWSRNKKLS